MLKPAGETVHASAVLVGERALLIRGPAGSGKSRLALALMEAAHTGALPYARLVADDRVRIFTAGGRLLAAPPEPIRGLIEVRGLGIRRVDCEPLALVSLLVDLDAKDGARLPEAGAEKGEILGIRLPRLPVAAGEDAFPLVIARLSSAAAA
ncbi:MAG TPA: HPr kinase/phosphatase C-terminal domain-containing protein [Xanthobacteraceae bacterium]|nr:HPr kinase/phosphatase C-terminal domain-containing protein [Xanthobacteraceae bacterium]